MRVGVLHPGEMGVTVLESLMANDVSATWVKEGRRESTIQRASSVPSLDTLEELTDSADHSILLFRAHHVSDPEVSLRAYVLSCRLSSL